MTTQQDERKKSIDPEKGGSYPEWLYSYAAIETSGVSGFANLSDADIALFHERGYLVIEDAFSQEATQQGLAGLVDLIDGKNPAFKDLQFEKDLQDKLELLSSEERQNAVRSLFRFVDYDERLKALAFDEGLLAVLRRVIGEEDLTMFQDMALLKPPRVGREKPWHQDLAFFELPLDITVVGVWLALDEATVENGCMMVIPGSHKEGAVIHFRKRDWQICDTDVYNDGAVAVPLKPGSVLLFHGLIHHGTPANLSEHKRRALQFHYRGASVKTTSEEERLANFGSEGKNVSC